MKLYFNYLIEVNIDILLLLAFYWLLFRNETTFAFKRNYLLIGILLSLILPLVTFDRINTSIPTISKVITVHILPEVVIYSNTPDLSEVDTATNPFTIIVGVYLIGLFGFLMLFMYRLLVLQHFISQHSYYLYKDKYKIIETQEAIPSSSFFHYIFLGEAEQLSEFDKEYIIHHEIGHVQLWHSADIILIELLKILFWFNPLMHLLKKTFTLLHEFQADKKVVEQHGINNYNYCCLLAKVALQSADFKLANHFNQSLTIKRIKMLKTVKKRMNIWKLTMILPILTGFFFIVACQDQVMKDAIENSKTLTQVSDYPPEVRMEINQLKVRFPDAKYTYIEGEQAEVKTMLDKAGKTQVIINNFTFKERGITGVLLQNMSNFAESFKNSDEVFTVVEQAASPVGGYEKFYEYIQANLHYPEAAHQQNIQGTVFIEFIVQKDGTLTNITILKGIGGGCDEEAFCVLSGPVAWNPGKQSGIPVKQRMTIPIKFQLSNSNVSVKPEPVEPVGKNILVESRKITSNGIDIMTGTVTDEKDNPLAGAIIIIMGTNTGTTSDSNGKFNLELRDRNGALPKGSLVFSYTGFEKKRK